jgi:dephospho-CoA kinase
MIIVVTGYPGSGKTTAADMMTEYIPNSAHVETGEAVRNKFRKVKNREPNSSHELGEWVMLLLCDIVGFGLN